MSAEHFQFSTKNVIDTSIIKRHFSKIYHQQEVNLKDRGKSMDSILGMISNYYQIGNAYLPLE